MDSSWPSFILGFFAFPFIYLIFPLLFDRAKKYKNIQPVLNIKIPISDSLKKEIAESIEINKNLGWINVIIQRIYFESIRNYTLEQRMRENILKSCSSVIGESFIKKLKIKNINFGSEAPYLKSIKLLTPEECENIIKNENKARSIKDDPITLNTFIKIEKLDLNKNNGENFDDESQLDYKEIFKIATFHGSFEYFGTIQIILEMKLPSSIVASLCVNVKKINSEFLFRVPAVNQPTRFEISLIKTPDVDFDVDSGFLTQLKKLYFQNSTSGFMKSAVLNAFQTSFVYPSWNQFVMPNVSSGKLQDFQPNFITTKNYESAMETIYQILLICGCDYKLMNVQNEIIYKKSYSTSKDQNHINFWSFRVKKQSKNEQNYKNFEGLSSDESRVLYSLQTPEGLKMMFPALKDCETVFEVKNIAILRMKFQLFDQEFIKVIYKNHVVLYKNNTKFSEFLVFKVQSDDLHIFNCSKNSSDIFFNDKRIEILKININSEHHFETNAGSHVTNFQSESEALEFGSKNESALKDISGTFITMETTQDEFQIKQSKFETMFNEALRVDNLEFNKFNINLKMSKRALKEFLYDPEIRIKMFEEYGKFIGCIGETEKIGTLIAEYREKDKNEINELRIHTLNDKKRIVDICPLRKQTFVYQIKNLKINLKNLKNNKKSKKENEEICSSELEDDQEENCFVSLDKNNQIRGREENKDLSSSYSKESEPNDLITKENADLIAIENSNISEENSDLTKESEEVEECIKKLSESKEISQIASCELSILYKSEIPIFLPNFFIESLKIKESFEKYMESVNKMNYMMSSGELIIERYVKAGTLYFEFKCEIEDDYTLKIFSCKKQKMIFEIKKIITVKPFKIIMPIDSDYIKIYFTPKYKRNSFAEYKFKEFDFKKDFLIQGVIGLNKSEKIKLKLKGAPSHVIFWEIDSNKRIKSYLNDTFGKMEIKECGILRADEKDYVLINKNENQKLRNIKIWMGLAEMQ